MRLVQEIDHEWVGGTIDVGHQTRYEEFLAKVNPDEPATPTGIQTYNDVTHRIIDQLGDKVFHFHVHDLDPKTWRDHQPLGKGVIDYPRLIAKLRQMKYQGWLMFEVNAPDMRASLADSKRRLEHVLSAAP